jgi:uncharacterized protein YbjT (DUF2867 family)
VRPGQEKFMTGGSGHGTAAKPGETRGAAAPGAGGLAPAVAIVGASGQVGTALRHRLAGGPAPVRALGRGDDLREGFHGADTVVHLAGTLRPRRPDTYQTANLGTVEATCEALAGTTVRRVVFLSFPGASPGSDNPYLRYKGEAERLLAGCGVPVVTFRAAHIFGPPERPGPTLSAMLDGHGGTVSVLGTGSQRYAWLALADVAAALAAAAGPDSPAGTFSLAGPDAWPLDEFVRRVSPEPLKIRHLPGWAARIMSRLVPALPEPLVDIMLRDCLPESDPAETARRFGLRLHGVDDSWPPPVRG